MEDIKNTFIENALKHGQALDAANSVEANKIHKKLSDLYAKLKQEGKWSELLSLIEHSDDNVKIWAASFLLRHDEEKALSVLNNLKTSSKAHVKSSAGALIDMWKKGMIA